MAMDVGVPCYGHDHAMLAVINMVMAVSWSGPGHRQDQCFSVAGAVSESEVSSFKLNFSSLRKKKTK